MIILKCAVKFERANQIQRSDMDFHEDGFREKKKHDILELVEDK